jgi:putative Mg2+ transporter-C (MgtC) family protein
MFILPESLSPDSRDFWLHLGTAVLCGGGIGLERQIRGKAAGARTSILICLGTSLFVTLGATTAPERADPTRVLGQVVTGIGFLGAGVILTREGRVLGVTTAAVIWVMAAIGCLIGLGYLRTAMVISLVTLGVLQGIELIETLVERRRSHGQVREVEGEAPDRRRAGWGRRSGDIRTMPPDAGDPR